MKNFDEVPFSISQFRDVTYMPIGNSGLYVPPIGLGTWKFGYPEKGDGSRVGEQQAFSILDRSVELGVTFWDTANRYNNGSGNSERIIGKWLESNARQRRNIILCTKIFGGMDGHTPNHSGLSRTNILESVYASLERLKVSYIDLLYFHAFDFKRPIDESLIAIEDLQRQDLVRYFGVSNFTVDNLKRYQKVIEELSLKYKIVAVQNQFDILDGEREPFIDVFSYAQQTGISFIAWSPMARGLLSERYLSNDKIGAGDRLFDEGILEAILDAGRREKLIKLTKMAHKIGVKLNHLALAYLLHLRGMGPVIPSCSNVSQLEENAFVNRIKLDDEQFNKIGDIVGFDFPLR